jgi:signal transduction histidine kinase
MAAIGQLASSVAHELNNPMSAVISLSQLLLKEVDPALPCHEDLKNIEEAALRCKKIVEDLLVFSRKPQMSRHEPVNLQEAVAKALKLLRPKLDVKGIVVKEDFPAGLSGIPIHPDPLQQVLINLISNARDAMESGGILRLRAWREKKKDAEYVVLSVQDTGRGIPAHQIGRIFEPFYTTKPPGKGTGLGLSICRRLMEALGGGIEVTSREGKGANFFVWFPLQSGDVRT